MVSTSLRIRPLSSYLHLSSNSKATSTSTPVLVAGRPKIAAVRRCFVETKGAERAIFAPASLRGGLASRSKVQRCPARGAAVRVRASGAEDLSPVLRRLDSAGRAFSRVGTLGFWTQLILTTVSAVIVVFSIIYRQAAQLNTELGLYLNLFGLCMGYLGVFWAVSYGRLSRKLRKAVGTNDPEDAPPRDSVCIPRIKTGIVINLIGLAATLVGLESTCGLLFAKCLAFTAQSPFAIGAQATAPVLALDIFVVQASANTLFSHFIGLSLSIWLYNTILKDPPCMKGASSPA